MPVDICETHAARPSALHYMLRAMLRSPSPPVSPRFEPLVERWADVRLGSFSIDGTDASNEPGAIVLPHVFGFRLHMALLTHRAFPIPIWSALQIRNAFELHAPFASHDVFDLETRSSEPRAVAKGLEIDLHTRMTRGDVCVWSSVVTYFYRGRFGEPGPTRPDLAVPDCADAPVIVRFRMPSNGRLRAGAATGDFNGIHQWGWYARRLGFRDAFLHPQRAAIAALAHLSTPRVASRSFRLWIKGPVYYGAEVELREANRSGETEFAVHLSGDPRPALVGLAS